MNAFIEQMELNKNVKIVLQTPLAKQWNEPQRRNGFVNAFSDTKNENANIVL